MQFSYEVKLLQNHISSDCACENTTRKLPFYFYHFSTLQIYKPINFQQLIIAPWVKILFSSGSIFTRALPHNISNYGSFQIFIILKFRYIHFWTSPLQKKKLARIKFFYNHVKISKPLADMQKVRNQFYRPSKQSLISWDCLFNRHLPSCAGILEQSTGARNLEGIGLSYRHTRARIYKLLRSLRIDSKNQFRQPVKPGGPVRQPCSHKVPSPRRLFKNSSSG